MTVSFRVGFIFVFLCFFLVVMRVKIFSSTISLRSGGSEETVPNNAGFSAPYLANLLSPW
jgi:hypothetical protein